MSARLCYIGLEIKRAWKRFPFLAAGAAALLFLMGAAALLAGRALYGDAVTGRISVGVVLPEGDRTARQAASMLSSMESVKSLCDFIYMDEEACRESLAEGELAAALLVPDDLVSGIMNGENTPITVLLPEGNVLESRIFRELTQAGAATLGAGQAGIYAGDELLALDDMTDSISRLEEDLNRMYLRYSLPRLEYFRRVQVSAAGDVDTLTFYGISMSVFFLLLCAVPVSGFLAPWKPSMRRKLALEGIGSCTCAGARILGLASLLAFWALILGALAGAAGYVEWQAAGSAALVLVCLGCSGTAVFLYQAAGGFFGGVMLLFLASSAMHFMAGGFLPLVFLPKIFAGMSAVNPSFILMEGVKMIVTAHWDPGVFARLGLLAAAGFAGTAILEEVRRR